MPPPLAKFPRGNLPAAIRANEDARWRRFAAGRRRCLLRPGTAARRAEIILGVDPSLRGTGYGVIRAERQDPLALAHGTISCPASWERSRCLVKISQTLRDVLHEHQPKVCVVEGLFYAQNLQTAIIMGEARGAALAAVAEAGMEIYEIATSKVKQAIVGYGAAQKSAVAKMVQRLLNLPSRPRPTPPTRWRWR